MEETRQKMEFMTMAIVGGVLALALVAKKMGSSGAGPCPRCGKSNVSKIDLSGGLTQFSCNSCGEEWKSMAF